MAGTLLYVGDKPNVNIMRFIVDSEDDIKYLPTTTSKGTGKFSHDSNFNMYAPMGSECIVGNGDSEILVYMLFSQGWKKL